VPELAGKLLLSLETGQKMKHIRVGINGYGVIGKRVADAVALQPDMQLAGICDVDSDWRIKMAAVKNYSVFAANKIAFENMNSAGIPTEGLLEDLAGKCDVMIDCTPGKYAAENIAKYRQAKVKFILQGGEKHAATGHSFVAEINYATAIRLECTRIVSCNTTSIARTLGALHRAELIISARGTLMRRAIDPWQSDKGGIMNTLVPERKIPSHHSADVKTIIADLNVVTAAVKVPETLGHLHYWYVKLRRKAGKDEILNAFKTSGRVALIKYDDGLSSINTIKEMMLVKNRPLGDMYEVALWEDMLEVDGDELYYAYVVDNQAIVIPENIDAIRALFGEVVSPTESINKTDQTLGVTQSF
jgi:glyceraldehyde-3-phosphate dehydrogenase (NAD(P))